MNSNKYDYLLVNMMAEQGKFFPLAMIKKEGVKIHNTWRKKFNNILKKGFKLLDEGIEIPTHLLNEEEKEILERYTHSKKKNDGFEVYSLQSTIVKYHKQVINESYDELTPEQQHINDRLAYYNISESQNCCANDKKFINTVTDDIEKNEYLKTMSNI